MANKIFKGVKFPGMDDYYVLPEAVITKNEDGIIEIESYMPGESNIVIDKTLSTSGAVAEAKAVGDALQNKVSVVEGSRLMTAEEANKLAKLVIDESGNVGSTDIINVGNAEGILTIEHGGTGASDAATARANLGAAPAATTLQMLDDINSKEALPADHACLFRTTSSNWDGLLPLQYAAYARLRSGRNGNYTTWLGGNGANLYYTMTSDGNMPTAEGWKRIAFANEVVKPADMAAALAQKAPAGFGYGETMTYLIESENLDARLNEILSTMADQTAKQIQIYDQGFYPGAFICTLWRFTGDYALVDAVSYGSYRAVKCKRGGTWYPWTWENPPMHLGSEYRTTERCNTSKVYTRLVSLGVIEGTGEHVIAHGIENVNLALEVSIFRVTGECLTHAKDVSVKFNRSSITINFATSSYGIGEVRAIVKYTKTET